MAKVISIFNQAGGVSKSTVTHNLGYHLAIREHRVLLVDMDPQASLTTFMGLEPPDLERTMYDALSKEEPLPIEKDLSGLDLAPSNILLADCEQELVLALKREERLKEALAPVRKKYDFILIDCPPSLGLLSLISLVASNHVLVPIETQYKAFKGTDSLNPVEETEGILGLLALKLEKTVEEVISFLRRMENEAGGKATNNVIGSEESSAVVEVFTSLGRMSWESFVKNRLAILNLPEDILKVLRSGQLEYTKGRAIAQVKDESFRQQLLEEAVTQGLSLNQIREKIKALKSPESPQPPLEAEELREQLGKLNRLSKKSKALENPKTRQQVEKLLSQLQDLLSE